jgi:predicted nucleic acid-binding protein
MIVLDTNVISEAMKSEANPAVRAWLNEQVAETLYSPASLNLTVVRDSLATSSTLPGIGTCQRSF